MKDYLLRYDIRVVSDLYLASESILFFSKTINIPDTLQNIVCKLLHCETFASRPALIEEMEDLFQSFLDSSLFQLFILIVCMTLSLFTLQSTVIITKEIL